MFIKYNANPKGWKTGDCVIRACAVATQQTWEDTYDQLYAIGRKKCRPMEMEEVYGKFLEDKGFVRMKQLKRSDGTKCTVNEVIEQNPDSILVIHSAHHVATAIDGRLIDTWYCGHRTAGRYYKLPIDVIGDDLFHYLLFIDENKENYNRVL